jgi:hypothetical protein
MRLFIRTTAGVRTTPSAAIREHLVALFTKNKSIQELAFMELACFERFRSFIVWLARGDKAKVPSLLDS